MSGPGWHGPAEAQSSTCPSHVTFRPHPLKRQSWAQKPQNEKVDPGIGQWPTPDRESLPPRVLPPCIERAVKLCNYGAQGHRRPWPAMANQRAKASQPTNHDGPRSAQGQFSKILGASGKWSRTKPNSAEAGPSFPSAPSTWQAKRHNLGPSSPTSLA